MKHMQSHLYRGYPTWFFQITEKPAVLLVDVFENLQEESLCEVIIIFYLHNAKAWENGAKITGTEPQVLLIIVCAYFIPCIYMWNIIKVVYVHSL